MKPDPECMKNMRDMLYTMEAIILDIESLKTRYERQLYLLDREVIFVDGKYVPKDEIYYEHSIPHLNGHPCI